MPVIKNNYPVAGRLLLALLLTAAAWLGPRPAQAQQRLNWARDLGGFFNTASGITTDSSGYTYVTVSFRDTLRVGTEVRYGRGTAFICLAPGGQPAWVRTVTGDADPTSFHSAVDRFGNVWFAGRVGRGNTFAIEGRPGTTPPPVASAWLVSYTRAGAFRWADVQPTSSLAANILLSLDGAGNGYLAFERGVQEIMAGPNPGPDPSYSEYRVRRYSNGGQLLQQLVDAHYDGYGQSLWLTGMACDPRTGTVYVTAGRRQPMTVAGTPLAGAGDYAFLASYSATLSPRWVRNLPTRRPPGTGAPGTGWVGLLDQLRVTAAGQLLAHTHPAYTSLLTGVPLRNATSVSGALDEEAVVCFSPTGVPRWATLFGNNNPADPSYMSMYLRGPVYTADHRIIISGAAPRNFAFGTTQFRTGPWVAAQGNMGSYVLNDFIAALDTTGHPLWLRQSNNDSTGTYSMYLAAYDSQHTWLCGTAGPGATYDGQPLYQPVPGPSPGIHTFVAHFAEAPLPRLQFLPAGGAPASEVYINGRDFQGTTAVYFNGVAATGFRINPTGDQLVATVPAGASTGPISLSTPTGTQTTTTAFRVSAPLGTRPGTAATLRLYPNPLPRHGQLTVASTEVVQQLTLVDALGRVVQQAAPARANPQLALADVAPGVYALRIGTASGTVVRRLVVE